MAIMSARLTSKTVGVVVIPSAGCRRRGSRNRRRNNCAKKIEPCLSVPLLVPVTRLPNCNGTSATRKGGCVARISSRILNPLGRSSEGVMLARRTRKKPVIGSLTRLSLIGKRYFASRTDPSETACRHRLSKPAVVPPAK